MFELGVFMIIIGIAAAKINSIAKQKGFSRSSKIGATGTGNSIMAVAVGGAATMFLLSQITNNNNLDQQTIAQMQDMDLNQLQDFAVENQLMQQEEMNQLMDQYDPFDPYTNPGTDQVVDEYYHGIDHGLDDDYSHDDFGMDDFGGGFDDFGGGGFGGGFGNDF